MSSFRKRLMMAQQDSMGGISIVDAPNGVYYLRDNNQLYTKDKWGSSWNESLVGVAIVNKSHPHGGFVIGLSYGKYTWGAFGIDDGMTITTNADQARKDMSGRENTEIYISIHGPVGDDAFRYCNGFVFKHGKKGYLGSTGEWKMLNNNRSEVNKYLSNVGAQIPDGDYWTSVQYDYYDAWEWVYQQNGMLYRYSRPSSIKVVPFAPLK